MHQISIFHTLSIVPPRFGCWFLITITVLTLVPIGRMRLHFSRQSAAELVIAGLKPVANVNRLLCPARRRRPLGHSCIGCGFLFAYVQKRCGHYFHLITFISRRGGTSA